MTAKSPADSVQSTAAPGPPLLIGQCATLACLMEATAPKPGNVHRGCDFDNMTFLDFAVSATAIGPAIEAAPHQGVGTTVLQAIQATRQWVQVNTNLGSVLLIAPLASVPREQSLVAGVAAVLRGLTAEDARQVYEAIRLAQPGGLGRADRMDVAGPPPPDLLAAMRLAADRDLVAGQYVNGFQQVLEFAVPSLIEGVQTGWRLTDAVIHTQMRLMSEYPDSLIARKCGDDVARRSAEFAARVLAAGRPGEDGYQHVLADFDFWLRCDGNRRNPGTTADLLAAALFVILRDGRIRPPFA